jgi:hypothetical protein
MKYPLSIITGMAFCLTGWAQPTPATSTLTTLPSVTIHLKESGPILPGAFSHFEVIDQRADTARIGIHTFVPTFGHSRNRQLLLPASAATEVAGFLNKYFARPDAHWSALIVLRNLWLSDANYLKEEKVKDKDVLFQKTHIRLKAEIYACNDGVYIPILRFDTVQTYGNLNQYNNWSSYYSLWENDLTAILGEMADSASALTAARVENGRRLQRDEIRQFNQSRFEPPITETAALTRGVYANFQDFRDNSPSIQNFEVRQDKKDLVLYIKDENGASQYSHDSWGYCDGRSIFIMRDGKLYPLVREGKAFYFYGQAYKENLKLDPNSAPGILSGASALDILLDGGYQPGSMTPQGAPGTLTPGLTKIGFNRQRIYSVDMDSGTVY